MINSLQTFTNPLHRALTTYIKPHGMSCIHSFQLFFLTVDWLLVMSDNWRFSASTLCNGYESIHFPSLIGHKHYRLFTLAAIHRRGMIVCIIIICVPPKQMKVIVQLEPPSLYFRQMVQRIQLLNF